MAVTDPSTLPWIDANAHWLHYALPALGALIVVVVGKWLATCSEQEADAKPALDLATAADEPARSPAPAPSAAGPAVLFVVDDTPNAQRTSERFMRLISRYREPVLVHLLNVQPPAHGDVGVFVSGGGLKDYHHDEGAKALRPVREQLERSAVSYRTHIGMGDPAHVVAHFAKETGSEQIFFGGEANIEASETARRAGLPVTVVHRSS
jgi:hypothetical protein